MKQGINYALPVEFEDLDLDTVERIEFIFSYGFVTKPIKTAVWVNGNENESAVRDGEKNIILVKWTTEETYRVKSSSKFFMDTRIHIYNTDESPITPVIELTMEPTLFI